jgi:hypothetical protein
MNSIELLGKSCLDSKLGQFLINKNTLQAAAAISVLALSIALLILGTQQFHMFTETRGFHSPIELLAPFNLTKTAALLGGAGAAFAISAFILKKLIVDKVAEIVHKQQDPWMEHAINVARFTNVLLAVTAIAAGIVFIGLALQYFNQLPQFHSYFYHYTAYYALKATVIRAAIGLVSGCALASFGFLDICNLVATRTIHLKQIIVKPTANIDNL